MAEVKVKRVLMTHKNSDPKKPRRKLAKTRVTINKKPFDLRKIAARRRLVPRR